ncbi:hypothetical protein ElyMa_000793000, partial [Elysia marginata]
MGLLRRTKSMLRKSKMADGLAGPDSQSSATKTHANCSCCYVIRHCRGDPMYRPELVADNLHKETYINAVLVP